MRTDVEIRLAGLNAPIEVLGLVEAERFIASVCRDRFNAAAAVLVRGGA